LQNLKLQVGDLKYKLLMSICIASHNDLFVDVILVINKRWTFGIRGLNRLMSSLTAVMDMDIKQRLELAVYHTRVINIYIDDNGLSSY